MAAGGARGWFKTGGPDDIRETRSGLRLSRYFIETRRNPALKGRRILFISDLHIRGGWTRSLLCPSSKPLRWRGLEWVSMALSEACGEVSPDWLVFGGDLVVHSCWLEEAMSMMEGLRAKVRKLSVYGNWDRRRRRWFPSRIWDDYYRRAGFEPLANSGCVSEEVRFYGLDDFKTGIPSYRPPEGGESSLFNCVVSHNPDAAMESLSASDFAKVDLVLCGHTHGGQARLPLFGAFKTSSKHWKRFEWGRLAHSEGRATMLVCSGVGATLVNLRLNCPPEALWIEFS